MAKVIFTVSNLAVDVRIGTELLDMYKRNPLLPLRFGCTHGSCGVCALEIEKGSEFLSPLTVQEKKTLNRLHLEANFRLACQCAIAGPGKVCLKL